MAIKIKPKAKKGGLERKKRYLKSLKCLMEDYNKIIIITADYVGSNEMQKIRRGLRDYNSVLLMGKNTLMKKGLSHCITLNHHNVQNLKDFIKGNVGLIFTHGDLKQVKDYVENFKTFVPARAGLVAPVDVVVPSGITSLEPYNTSFFQALNIPTKISKGAVEIIDRVDLIKKGEKVGTSEVQLLAKLNIKPFSYGLVVKMIYESGSVYAPEILDITEDDVAEKFAMGVTNVSAFAMSISYPSLSAIPHMIVNGYMNVLAIAIATDYTLSLKEYHQDPVPITTPAVPTTSKVDVPVEEQSMSYDVGKPKPKLPSSLILEREQESRQGQSQVVPLPHVEDVASDEEDGTSDNHMLVQPMYQIFSITIHHVDFDTLPYPKMYKIKSVDDGLPCQVFGLVRVFVENGKTFDIFNRNKDNAEVVKFGGFLSIHGFPILQVGAIKVAVYIYDLAHDVEIANEIIDVYCERICDYDQAHVTQACGEYGFASIHHSIFQHAISANIEGLALEQVRDSGIDAHAHLHGTVSAHLERSYASCTSEVQEFPSSILFDNRDTTEYIQFGTHISLFRTCVIVPAFYSLKIMASFKDDSDRDVSIETKLSVVHKGSTEKYGKGRNCEMKLVVKWSSMIDAEPTRPNLQLSGATQLPGNIASAKPMAFPCVEVFSVSLCLDKKFADVSGSIKIKDSSHTFFVFDDEQSWYYGESLDLKAPFFSFDDEPFKVHISLVDEEKCVISKGRFEWDCSDDDAPTFRDRFLCSIIQGDIGYAAVHYSMITYAVQANIDVYIKSKCCPHSVVRVHGRITAEYGNYDYSCSYNQVYYKSTLFLKPEDDGVQVEIGLASPNPKYTLPLAKSLMAVPLDDLLIINLSLKVIGPGQKVEELEKSLEFKTNGGSTGVVYRDDYRICVNVNWNYLRQNPELEQGARPDG